MAATPVILVFRRQKQVDLCKFKASLVHVVRFGHAGAMVWYSMSKKKTKQTRTKQKQQQQNRQYKQYKAYLKLRLTHGLSGHCSISPLVVVSSTRLPLPLSTLTLQVPPLPCNESQLSPALLSACLAWSFPMETTRLKSWKEAKARSYDQYNWS